MPIAVIAFASKELVVDNVQTVGDLQGKVPNLQIYAACGSNAMLTAYISAASVSPIRYGV